MDKEAVVHLQNGMLLSREKEWDAAICSNKDGPGDYHTAVSEVSQMEKGSIIWHHLYTESKKWYRWTYLQNSKTFTDLEDKLMVIKGERVGGDKLGAWDQQIHTNYI